MKILIIGGDERFISLKHILIKQNFEVDTLFLDNKNNQINKINDFNIIFLPIPFLRNECLNSPFIQEKISMEMILNILNKFEGKIIGGFSKNTEQIFKERNLNFTNILNDEKFTLVNAIITAEGTIEKIINKSEKSLFESNVCILGYGRVSKALARRIEPLCKNLIVYNNPSVNYIYTKINNIKSKYIDSFKDDIQNFDVIVNTIPSLILNKELLDKTDKNSLILDLASLPGGVDFNYAKKLNLKTIHYLGVPSKVSCLSSANTIFNFLKENS